jgi:hypothetical protein
MVRSFLFSVLCLVICSSHAQVRVGVQAGYNSAKWALTVPQRNWETSNDAVSGFNVGMLGMLELKKRIGLRGALLFNGGGTKLKHRYRFNSSLREIKLYTLNLPVTAMYKVDIKKMRFGLGGGFYVAYVLSGTEKGTTEQFIINGSPEIDPVDNKVEFGSSDQPFDPSSTNAIKVNRFDAGYVVGATIEFNRRLVLQASYNGGLHNLLPGGYSFGGNFKNKVISLSLAVLLSRGRS